MSKTYTKEEYTVIYSAVTGGMSIIGLGIILSIRSIPALIGGLLLFVIGAAGLYLGFMQAAMGNLEFFDFQNKTNKEVAEFAWKSKK